MLMIWGELDAYLFIDVLPEQILRDSSKDEDRFRYVVRNRAGAIHGLATCRLRITQDFTDLDYTGELERDNLAEDMDIGVTRLRFGEEGTTRVEWRTRDPQAGSKTVAAIALMDADVSALGTWIK